MSQENVEVVPRNATITAIATASSMRRSCGRGGASGRYRLALAILALTTVAQVVVFVATNSIALLADLIHNGGDALTAVPLGVAFAMRSERAERNAGFAVVAAIFVSACVAGVEAVRRIINPEAPDHLVALAIAGGIGFVGNWLASIVRGAGGPNASKPCADRRWQPRSR